MNMFTDDAKRQRKIIAENLCLELQNDLAKLYEWNQKWQMEFNAEKCHVIKCRKMSCNKICKEWNETRLGI